MSLLKKKRVKDEKISSKSEGFIKKKIFGTPYLELLSTGTRMQQNWTTKTHNKS